METNPYSGYEVPPAHRDRYGSRPGLEPRPGQHLVLDRPPANDLPWDELVKMPPTEVVLRSKEAEVSKDRVPSPPPISPLAPAETAARPFRLPEVPERPLPVGSRAAAPVPPAPLPPAPVPPEDRYVNVILAGDFGSFKSKPADVVFCDTCLFLVYAGRAGDAELLFEPPPHRPFRLRVETESGYREVSVCHYGLISRIELFKAQVVVLIRAPESDQPDET